MKPNFSHILFFLHPYINLSEYRPLSPSVCLVPVVSLAQPHAGNCLGANSSSGWVAYTVQPEGETLHIIAYRVIIHAECVAAHPHIQSGKQHVIADLLLGDSDRSLIHGQQRAVKGGLARQNHSITINNCVISICGLAWLESRCNFAKPCGGIVLLLPSFREVRGHLQNSWMAVRDHKLYKNIE